MRHPTRSLLAVLLLGLGGPNAHALAEDATMDPHDGATRGDANAPLRLHLRSRVQPFKGSEGWREVVFEESLDPAETALLLCDVWDKHWCRGANERLAAMLPRMSQVVRHVRARGVLIIHAPSDTMAFYADTPQRRRAQGAPAVEPPKPLPLPDPPLPVDSSDGGCTEKTPCRQYRAWTRQHPAIEVAEPDAVTDNGREVYHLLRQRGTRTLLILGVHTNMCVLHRSFGIKPMTRWGVRCVLVRDLTDTMYNPDRAPRVTHERGTELVVEYIERHWCPTILSDDLLQAGASGGKAH
jgi:nicotinamidase-related amidase